MIRTENEVGRDFSIVLGGPFFQLLRRMHLSGSALELIKLRVSVLVSLAWIPLLLLSLLSGQAWGSGLDLTFVKDLDVHIRFLIAMPLLILSESVVHERMLSVVGQFEERRLIPAVDATKFNRAISSALRLRNSYLAEALMVVIAYVIGYQFVWKQSMALDATAWYSDPTVTRGSLSWAGIWFRFLSLPLFQFLFLRWYYRIFIWMRFLFQVSRIRLSLVLAHPDQTGGLGFLANSVHAFLPLAVAHGALLAGAIANHIFYEGANLMDFKWEVLAIATLIISVVVLPLFFFSPQLADAKRLGSIKYGLFATRFARSVEDRWVPGAIPADTTTIGNDIQSLADLANSYATVERMQMAPVTRSTLLMLAVFTVAPIVPLTLTMMPLSEVIKMLAGVLL
jgi:hypothetical protein